MHHAALMAAQGRFSDTRRDLELAVATGKASLQVRHQRALCCLHDGDGIAYRAAAAEMLACFKEPRNKDELHYLRHKDVLQWTVWTCILAPRAINDYTKLVELARQGHELAPDDAFMTRSLGATLFRAGQWDEAVAFLAQAAAVPPNQKSTRLYERWFLAMSHHQLGHETDACESYDRAEAETARMLAEGKRENCGRLNWVGRATLELLRAEAAEMFGRAAKEKSE
jgi:tetratricopeptide (TPR) repeat protein